MEVSKSAAAAHARGLEVPNAESGGFVLRGGGDCAFPLEGPSRRWGGDAKVSFLLVGFLSCWGGCWRRARGDTCVKVGWEKGESGLNWGRGGG